jgi:hypothetical protein
MSFLSSGSRAEIKVEALCPFAALDQSTSRLYEKSYDQLEKQNGVIKVITHATQQ